MRPKLALRNLRPAHVAAAGIVLAIPGSAVALAAGRPNAPSAIQFSLDARQLAYNGELRINGSASSTDAGQPVQLQFAPSGSSSWRVLASSRLRSDGRFSLAAALRKSGLVRVAGPGGSAPRSGASSSTTGGAVASSGSQSATSSARPVSVSAQFRVQSKTINELGGQPVHVRGRLLPELGGRQVTLLGRSGGSWKSLATTRTGPHGGFDIRYHANSASRRALRVQFAGDRLNTRSSTYAGRLTSFRQSVASWYNDAGATACGFHAQYGVANRDLPCGTKVTFQYGGHTVNAVVDDRGPFVAGRDWDLNQNTAGALGFGGVDSVWSSL